MRTLGAVLGLALAATPATAQFWDKLSNPKIKVPIKHPPGLGLQINKVAFGPATGEGAQEFVDALVEGFVRSNLEVIERQRLQTLLQEHDLALSGYVDQKSAAEMGKILGPAVLVFVSMQRHATEQKRVYNDWRDGKGVPHRTWISRTQAFVRGSVRSVDLASARIFAATTVEASPMRENKINDQCCAEFPNDYEVLDMAMRDAVGQAHRLFLPWTEATELYFFDDKDCNLKTAFSMLKAGDLDGTLRQSLENLETCKAFATKKPKTLAHAYHNVGMAHFTLGDLDKALEALGEAQRIKPADIHTEASAQCNKARQLATEMQRVEERMAFEAQAAGSKRALADAAAASEAITNDEVVGLTKAKMPEAIILAKIRTSRGRFDTSTSALIKLKSAGVSDAVIQALMEKGLDKSK